MNKNLQLIDETPRLVCVWGASEDAGMPLICKWVVEAPERSQSRAEPDEKHCAAIKAQTDLLGLICWLTPVSFTTISFSPADESDSAVGKDESPTEAGGRRRCA